MRGAARFRLISSRFEKQRLTAAKDGYNKNRNKTLNQAQKTVSAVSQEKEYFYGKKTYRFK